MKYKTNPPTSGDHDPTPAEDGVYEADSPPDVEQSVHSLEHGRINIQYKAGHAGRSRSPSSRRMANEEVKGTAALPHAGVPEPDRAWSPRWPPPPGASR